MKTGSLRLRVTVATLLILAVVVTGVVAGATLLYRSSLQHDLRRKLDNAALAFEKAWPGPAAKQLIGSLALDGIATDIQTAPVRLPPAKAAASGTPPVKPGSSITSSGALLVLTEVLSDGTRVTFSASRARIRHSVNRLLLFEIVVALAALALAALILRRVTATTLRPLTEISETATRIARGQTSRLNPERADTELGRLAAAFDRMVASLEIAAAQAQSSEAAMRRFLADASHELRTPAAALHQASAETLLREQPERPERDRIEARLARDSARLGRLVDDLLNLARIEGGQAQSRAVVDLAALAQASVAESRVGAGSVEVSTELTENTPVLGDAAALNRALRNLLDNALTAAGPNGHVCVSVYASNGHAVVRVVDDGPGIPEHQRDRVFERFVRLDPSPPGTGLGLAIARQIARQHGGDITCNATERGASFKLRLPLVGTAATSPLDEREELSS